MRVFLDANILFSAAKSDGAVRALLRLLLEANHDCCADEYVVIEARRNLIAKSPQGLAYLENLLAQIHIAPARMPGPAIPLVDWLPEKDRPVLAAALRLQCDVLVTGDRTHFGTAYGKTLGGVTLHSPRSLAEWLLVRG